MVVGSSPVAVININIKNDQVNDLVDKIFKVISKRDSTPQDSTPQNLNIRKFLLIYKELIKSYYSSDIFGKNSIDTKKINKALIDYVNKEITLDEFLQIYNVFINDFDKFRKVMNKKQLGAKSPNQKNLLNYGNKFKKVVERLNPSGSGLKILTPQQMFTRLPILLAQVKAGNNSEKLKNEIRRLLYFLYRSKKISKTVYKNLIAAI